MCRIMLGAKQRVDHISFSGQLERGAHEMERHLKESPNAGVGAKNVQVCVKYERSMCAYVQETLDTS